MSRLAKLWRAFCDQLVPPSCLICHKPIAALPALCGACWAKIDFIDGPICARSGVPLPFDLGADTVSLSAMIHPPAYDVARAAMHYDGEGAHIVKRLKFADGLAYAPLLAHFMARAGAALLAEADYLIPVPLHPARLRARRFNQSVEIARALSRNSGVPLLPDALRRKRNTPQQIGLSFRARQRNLRGAIEVNAAYAERLRGKSVVIIDDVYTTGATSNSCARALRKAKPKHIAVLTAARVIMPQIIPL